MRADLVADDRDATRASQLAIVYQPIDLLKPDPGNARKHSKKQIAQIAGSVRAFGFITPILVDANLKVIAGHGRLLAARQLGLSEVPTISVEHLTPEQAKAFAIADNRLGEIATWDDDLLAEQLRALSEVELDFSLDVTGFDIGQIDFIIGGAAPRRDRADKLPKEEPGPAVSRLGDLWQLGPHRIYCGSATDEEAYEALMRHDRAAAVFSDLPYGSEHRATEAILETIEEAAIVDDLTRVCTLLTKYSSEDSLHYLCTGWRHLSAVMKAALLVYSALPNICVWAKDKAGAGSLYRNQHELILALAQGRRHGSQPGCRDRSNLWRYPEPRSSHERDPRKPVQLVADALLDSTNAGDIVLDALLGSGTTLIAAEETKRVCHGLARNPRSLDVAIRRWQAFTGQAAHQAASGRSFDDLRSTFGERR